MSTLDIVRQVLSEETIERFAQKHGARKLWELWSKRWGDRVDWDRLSQQDQESIAHISEQVLNDFVHWALSEIAIQDAESESA